MSQYILINRIQVQNANAIAGFTWGFPAITHFLGFTHNLSRKLSQKDAFNNINLGGCAVISHTIKVHTYGSNYDKQFTQSRNPPYLASHKKDSPPPVIEEGKMNMTVSLLIECEGNIGNKKDDLLAWINNVCYLQRLAGGTILAIKKVALLGQDQQDINQMKRLLLPGFVLMDRAGYLQTHYEAQQKINPNAELFDAWLDFIALKQTARPKSDLIQKHFSKLEDEAGREIADIWREHLDKAYEETQIPTELMAYFANTELGKKLSKQWQDYCNPDEKTDADWAALSKPESGYLVPIMTGYKAISSVYQNAEVANTRDDKTDVCFVESVHSVGEWLSAHRLNAQDFSDSLWRYFYEENWYLCRQGVATQQHQEQKSEDSDDNF